MKQIIRLILTNIVLALAVLFVVGLHWHKPLLLTVVLIIISVVMLRSRKNAEDWWLYLFSALAGPSAEAVAIAFGAWEYALPLFLGIPMWLPFLWGTAGVLIKRTADDLKEALTALAQNPPIT